MACLREEFLHGAPPCECCQGHDRDWAAYCTLVEPLEDREDAVTVRERTVARREQRAWTLYVIGWLCLTSAAGFLVITGLLWVSIWGMLKVLF